MIRISFVLCNVLAAAVGQTLDCPWVTYLDCSKYLKSYMCGTDLVTYENKCDFAQSQCTNKNLHVIAEGTCQSFGIVGGSTTPGTTVHTMPTTTWHGPTTTHTPVFLGHNVVRDFLCRELSHEDCPNSTEAVCGTDHFSYPNFCEFEKARCTHSLLNVSHFGNC